MSVRLLIVGGKVYRVSSGRPAEVLVICEYLVIYYLTSECYGATFNVCIFFSYYTGRYHKRTPQNQVQSELAFLVDMGDGWVMGGRWVMGEG